MRHFLSDWLVCLQCHQELRWEISSENNDEIEQADAYCQNYGGVQFMQFKIKRKR